MVIYKITNRLNGKPYIGQTRQPLEKRFLQHAAAKTPLGDAMRKCGLENFTIEVVEECATPELTKERERFWIKVLKCKVPNGYNQSDGGESCSPKVRSHKPRFGAFIKTTGQLTVGEALKRFRGYLKLSQTDVAKSLGIMPQAYYRYESGRRVPTANIILKLAQAYDVSTDYLLGVSDKPKPTVYDDEEVREAFALRDTLRRVTATA